MKGYGDIKIRSTHSSTNMQDGILQKVLYVPGLGANLFSIGAATDLGLTAIFCQGNVHLYRNNQLELVGARQNNNLYLMDFVAVCVPTVEQGNLSFSSMSTWHRRFGHAHVNFIRKMAKEGSVTGLNLSNTDLDDFPCKGCALGKSHRQPFPIGRHRAFRVGELIHSDICGPMSTLSLSLSLRSRRSRGGAAHYSDYPPRSSDPGAYQTPGRSGFGSGYGGRGGNVRGGRRPGPDNKCHLCGEPGHFFKQCQTKK